ncbi:hypothetical protein [Celeribacter ethanolicus]|uniref:Flagellar biosynthesis protein FlgN n=1 Tax=Celeribacter ethanolicus TaxID=1758178 RepID=A0A291GDJ3_9RHOB|nr:hypothetical protein [Celeribacter ethanolicus]ATG48449.1 hypothetical protein CEW89_13270 [Celeribacter ethanolicus]TNE64107.1 MAG: hypothetical protein EP336_15510 [Paracoccaceae bacterium]
MAFLDAFRPASALADLLDKEKAAILKGDFATLETLSKSKESLLSLVAKSKTPVVVLQDLKKRSEHNKRLLMASAKGLRTARERILSLRHQSRGFTAYGPAGKATEIERKSLTMKRKA